MRRFYHRISFRIWFPYALVLLVLTSFVFIYYPQRQAILFRENKERELGELAKTVALGVELSLNANDYDGLKRTVDFVSKSNDLEFVAILEKDTISKQETLFASFPKIPEQQVLVRNESKYVYQEVGFRTPQFNGIILIAASRMKIDAMVSDLNRPVYIFLPIIFLLGLVLFFYITRQITRTIQSLTQSAHLLEQGNYEILIPGRKNKDEIDALRLELIDLRKKNDKLTSGLEEQVELRTALRDSELRMRQTMDAALDAIIIMDLEGIIRFWNLPAAKIFGFSKEEAIGNLLSELIVPKQYREAHERGMSHYRKTGEGPVLNKTIEISGQRKDGTEFPIDISIVPIDQDGIRLFCAFIRDITLRKQQEHIREEAQAALKRNEEELRKMNETLEQKVLENTKKNLDLSRMIVDHEKLATVGEISAGIAHDLNTPLSSIKAGAESVSYTLESLIGQQLAITDPVLLNDAIALAKPSIREVFIGGLQLRQESQQMMERLASVSSIGSIPESKRQELADKLVRCRILPAESDSIERVLQSKDPIALLNLIQQIQTIRSLLDSIRISVDRASNVIRDVRSFIKKDSQSKQSRISVRENISVVLNIFNFELKRDVTLDFQVDPAHTIMGYEVKLFQLWSNLVKNAIDAMDGETNKYLLIRSERSTDGLAVTVENTGPEIPAAILSQIFHKFFTTKQHKSGTGLGLSIVKNVADEHGATVSVRSANGRTAFTVVFPLSEIGQ